jgi:iron complex outermembrane receptor protein
MQRFQSPSIRSGFVAGLLLAVLALPTAAALAAEEGGLEEIIVTAQKREQSLQEVGISVSAFSADQLADMGATRTTDIVTQVPGLHMTAWSPAFTTFNLRGVSQNNFQDNLEAPVAVYMDGVYIASMNAINAQLFDMDRVEVLRGPQGTLFGRNATGGLIHFISHAPTESRPNGYLEAGYAEFNTRSVEGAFGGAFSDRVRGRIAGRYEKSDGYIKPAAGATGQTSAGANGYGLRGALQIDATDKVLVDLQARYSKDTKVPTGQYVVSLAGFDPNTGLGRFTNAYSLDPEDPNNIIGPTNFSRTPISGSPWRHLSNEDTYFNREAKSITGQIKADLGWGQLVSISNWQKLDKFYIEDAAGGLFFFPYNTIVSDKQWSEELRLSGERSGFRWQVGAYYLDMNWDTFQSVQGSTITGSGTDQHKISTYGLIDSRNWSVFGQTEWDFADRWTLVTGLRWSQDNKSLKMRRVDEDAGAGVPPTEVFNIADLTSSYPGINKIDYGDWAARLQVNFKPIEHQLLYLSFNRGIKGGNWSLDPLGAVPPENLKHHEEVLKAYELGWKAEFLDGKARLNSAVYYYDYNGYQAFSLTNLTPQVANSDATSHGGEIEFTAAPVKGLQVSLGAAFIDSKVDAVPTVFGGTVEAEFPSAPKTALNALVRYEWPAFGGSLSAQVDGQWNDKQFLEGTNSEVSLEPSYAVWNAHLGFTTAGDKFNVTAYLRNAGNKAYRTYDLDLGLLGIVEQAFAPPRQAGATISYHW